MADNDDGRYSRQLLFWGEETQRRISNGSLLIAGLGGLGATVSQIAARAGVARLHLVDDGVVAWSDLHRQSLYGECDVGVKKVIVAGERLNQINSDVEIITHDSRIDLAFPMPEDIDGVADCLDNFASRFVLYQVTPSGRFFVHGGVQGDQGQVLTLIKGVSQPLEEIMAGCRQPDETIPVTPDSVFVIAGLMANELFNNLDASPKLLDSFLIVDLSGFTFSFLHV
jgi:molybdopterin synthase catalytic subunit